MSNIPAKNPLPAVPVVPFAATASAAPAVPAHGSLAYRDGRFYRVHVPQPPVTNIRFVEVRLGGCSRPPMVLSIGPAALRLAIARGEVAILPAPVAVPAAVPSRPYPFEASATRAARIRRARLWRRPDVAALRSRGLLMTGEEYIRLLAHRARLAPLAAENSDD